MKLIFIFSLIILCVFQSLAQTPSATSFSDEEYEIWGQMWCSTNEYLDKDKLPLQVLQRETTPINLSLEKDQRFIPKIREFFDKAKLPDVTGDLIEDFNLKNLKSYSLERKFEACKNYTLVTKNEISEIFKSSNDGWKAFTLKYPKSFGYMSFSRIGLSRDKRSRLFFSNTAAGGFADQVIFIFFAQENSEWKEKVKTNLWVS